MSIHAPQHECRQSEDPRHAGYCACGQRLSRPRNVDLEREITRQAAYSVVDPQALIEHAERRAAQPHGYGATGHVRMGVDWLREARAEGADWRNYLCWWLEENPGDERAHDVLIALRFVALAYDRLVGD